MKNPLSIEFYSISVNFSIETLTKQVKPVVREKEDFDYHDKSFLSAFFGMFGLSGFLCKEQNPKHFKQLVCRNLENFG